MSSTDVKRKSSSDANEGNMSESDSNDKALYTIPRPTTTYDSVYERCRTAGVECELPFEVNGCAPSPLSLVCTYEDGRDEGRLGG